MSNALSIVLIITLSAIFLVTLLFIQESKEILLNCPEHQEKIVIKIDLYGIPHINSISSECTIFGLGYMHAYDRIFQILGFRLLAKGRMAEHFGEEGVKFDKFMISLRIDEAAKIEARNLNKVTFKNFEFYSEGINLYFSENNWKFENQIAGISNPDKWTVEDTVLIIKLYEFLLTTHWSLLTIREAILSELGNIEGAKFLFNEMDDFKNDVMFPNISNNIDVDKGKNYFIPNLISTFNTTSEFLHAQHSVGGSNSWVISGNLTKSGFPILANDPHVVLTSPIIEYIADIQYENNFVKGSTLIGAPLFSIGRSFQIAWGCVLAYAENLNIYKIEIEGNNYVLGGKKFRINYKNCTIKIKNKKSQNFLSKWSNFGPIFDELDPKVVALISSYGNVGVSKLPISIEWHGLYGNSSAINSLFGLAFANSREEFLSLIPAYSGWNLNINYATRSGDIGNFPLYSIRVINKTIIPDHFLTDINNHNGLLNQSIIPIISNPSDGYIVICNNKLTNDFFCSLIPNQPRCVRIKEILETYKNQNKRLTVEDNMNIQKDLIDIYAKNISQYLINIFKDINNNSNLNLFNAKNLCSRLISWDGNATIDSKENLIVYTWLDELSKLIYNKRMSPKTRSAIFKSVPVYSYLFRFIKDLSKGLNTHEKACKEYNNTSCLELISIAANNAIKKLNENLGSESNWKWGYYHTGVQKNIPFSDIKILSIFYGTYFLDEGTLYTVNLGKASDEDISKVGPIIRFITDLSSNSTFISSASGQRDSPFSYFFDNLHKMQENNEFIEL